MDGLRNIWVVEDLKDGEDGTRAPRRLLLCLNCHSEYSANRSDYFAADPSQPLMCCGEPLRLVEKPTVYVEVQK